MPAYIPPGGTIKFESEKNAQGRYTAVAASGGGGGSTLDGFTAETDFSVTDNGDGTLTVTDAQSRFGTKLNGQKPVRVFELGSNGSVEGSTKGRYTGLTNQSGISIVTTEANANDTTSMQIDYGVKSISLLAQIDQDANSEFYAFFTRKHNFTQQEQVDALGTSWNCKYMGFQSELSTNEGPFSSALYQGTGKGRVQSDKAAGETTGTIYDDDFNVTLTDKNWHPEEFYVKLSSSAGVADASYKWLRDGLLGPRRSGFVSHAVGETPYKYFKLMRKEDMISSSRTYIGFLIVEDSQCMPFITDQPNWVEDATTTHIKEPQIVTSWDSGEISFEKREGVYAGSLSGKSMYMRISDGTVLRIGGWS